MDLKEFEKICAEKDKVLPGEKPLLQCKAEDLSERQWELYLQFRHEIILMSKSDK